MRATFSIMKAVCQWAWPKRNSNGTSRMRGARLRLVFTNAVVCHRENTEFPRFSTWSNVLKELKCAHRRWGWETEFYNVNQRCWSVSRPDCVCVFVCGTGQPGLDVYRDQNSQKPGSLFGDHEPFLHRKNALENLHVRSTVWWNDIRLL